MYLPPNYTHGTIPDDAAHGYLPEAGASENPRRYSLERPNRINYQGGFVCYADDYYYLYGI